jgi:uncharacterized YigZ family protein
VSAERYRVPSRTHQTEHVERRSRFVATLAHAPDAEAAHAFVARVKERFPDATHHCWAFVAGPPGSTRAVGMSDAGEPPGTAGRPMLTVLLHSGVGEVVAVCSRWFGGTKLGTGGLARAYAESVKRTLESLPTEEKVRRVPVEVVIGYAAVDALQRRLEELDARTVEESYGADVRYRVALPETRVAELVEWVAALTAGEGRVRRVWALPPAERARPRSEPRP